MTGNSCRHRANHTNNGVLEAETVSVIDVLHVGNTLNHVAAYHRDRSAWGAPHRDPVSRIKSASHRDKIRVPGMLLTGILEIGVLEVLLIGVLLPSGPDNLAIGEGLLCSSSCVQYVEVIKKEKMNRSKNVIKRSR